MAPRVAIRRFCWRRGSRRRGGRRPRSAPVIAGGADSHRGPTRVRGAAIAPVAPCRAWGDRAGRRCGTGRASSRQAGGLTSPTYWGVASNLREIVAAAHARDVAVYVDEAWGPHLGFHPCLPPSAMTCGADGAVTSPHKLLTGLSQAALLNIRGPRVDAARVAGAVKLTQTTSPLMPVLASLDGCRRQMALDGQDFWSARSNWRKERDGTCAVFPASTFSMRHPLDYRQEQYDPTRLVIDVQGLGMTGYVAERLLRERFQIAPEMSDRAGIVCLVTVGDTPGQSSVWCVRWPRCLVARCYKEPPPARALPVRPSPRESRP